MKSIRPYLGTYVEIGVREANQSKADRAIDAAFAAIGRVQKLMSRFDPDSDISRLNRECHVRPLTVAPWTLDVLFAAVEIHEASCGLFDCTSQASLSDLKINKGQIQSSKPIQLDLGGIAKGYAVDRAIEAILASDVSDACVNAGGDLRVIGACEEAIHIRDPANPQILRFAGMLKNGSLATSATYYSRYERDGEKISAIRDPRSGKSIVTRDSFTVIAPLCCNADALTKVLAVSKDQTLPCFSRYEAQTLMIRDFQ